MLHLGEVEGGVLEQVKGIAYSLHGFLGPRGGLLFPRYVMSGSRGLIHTRCYAQMQMGGSVHTGCKQYQSNLAPNFMCMLASSVDWA